MSTGQRRLSQEQQQEYISRDQFASRLSEYGWLTDDISRDLGEDFLVRIYDKGVSSGLGFLAQLKSVSDLGEYEIQGGYTSYRLEVGDLLHWEVSAVPVLVVIWDVSRQFGCWIGVPEAIEDLNKRRPVWREQKTARVRIPSSNRTDDEGLARIRQAVAHYYYPVIAKDEDIDIQARFEFPATPDGDASRLALERYLATGEPVEIDGKFVKEFKFSEWWTRLFGEMDLSDGLVAMGPPSSPEMVPARFDLQSHTGLTASIPYVELRAIKVGSEQITVSNELQSIPLRFTLTIHRSGSHSEISVTATGPGVNVEETREVLPFLQALADGGRFRITFLKTQESRQGEFPAGVVQAPPPDFLDIIEKLCLIQQETGSALALPADWSLDRMDIDAINELVAIVNTGEATLRNRVFTGVFQKLAVGLFLDAHRAGKSIKLKARALDGYVELLGERIHLGPFTQHICGWLDTPAAELEEMFAEMEPEDELEVRLVDADVVEEFDDWPKHRG